MTSNQTSNQYKQEDEVSLKEMILKLNEFWRELWKNWLLIGIITIPFVAYFFYDAYTSPAKYTAPITFMVTEDDGGGGGGLASIAGQFGFNIGGGSEFNKDKIVALAKSGKIVFPVILDTVEIQGVRDLLGNHLIDIFELREKWRKNEDIPHMHDFRFAISDRQAFDRPSNSALKACYALIIGTEEIDPLVKCGYEPDTGILKLAATSTSSELSYFVTNRIYENLRTFYILQQTAPQEQSLRTLQAKADSIVGLISQKELTLANLKDSNKNLILNRYRLKEARLMREIPALAEQYKVLLTNVESTDFILKNNTPVFQTIDQPFFPLKRSNTSVIRALILGGIIGLFFAISFVIGRKIYRDIMTADA